MHPRVLIVGTVPYNQKSTSRAFDAYFHYWEKENIAQIFSNTKKPCKRSLRDVFPNYRLPYSSAMDWEKESTQGLFIMMMNLVLSGKTTIWNLEMQKQKPLINSVENIRHLRICCEGYFGEKNTGVQKS